MAECERLAGPAVYTGDPGQGATGGPGQGVPEGSVVK